MALPLLFAAATAPACLGDLSFVRGEGDFCDPQTPCGEGLYCVLDTSECVPRAAVAASCSSDEACLSGFCESGLCCQTGCPGPCRACNIPGEEGSCVSVPEGDDPLEGCPGTTSCGPGALCQASIDWSAAWGDPTDQTVRAIAVGPDGEVVMVGAFEGTLNFETGPLQNPGPDDLFVAKLSAQGELLWARSVGGAGRQVAEDVAIDGAGNIYLAGWFTTEVDDEGTTIPSGGEADGLLVAYDGQGVQRWLVPLTAAAEQRLSTVEVADAGQLVVGGWARGTATFGACQAAASAGDDDALVATFAGTTGACTNMRAVGSPGDDQRVTASALDGDRIFMAVTGRGSVDFGDGPLDAGSDEQDVWLTQLSLGLVPSWTVLLDGPGDESAASLAADRQGGVWLIGGTTSSPGASAGAGAGVDDELTGGLERDVLLAHFAEGGRALLRASFGSLYDQVGRAVAVDASGQVGIAGDFELAIDFGNGAISSSGGADVFIAKLTPEGAPMWSRPLGSKMHERAGGLAVASGGHMAAALDFQDRVSLGGVSHQPAGGRDILITLLNP